MLNTVTPPEPTIGDGQNRFTRHMATTAEWTLDHLLKIAHRRKKVIAGGFAVGVALASIYVVSAVPKFTATVDLLMDTPKVGAVADSYGSNTIGFETGGIDSQVEILKSERISLGIIKQLDLKNHPLFKPASNALVEVIVGAVDRVLDELGLRDLDGDAAKTIEADRILERRIVAELATNAKVKRIGRTYVLELEYTSTDAAFAAQIANAYAGAYLTDQLDAKYDATTRAAVWLQDRISELKEKSLTADTKVQQFRSENGLLAVDGKLINEQQLVDSNAQLSDARAKLAEAEARVQRIDSIIKSGSVDAATDESLNSLVVADLRRKYLEASKKEADITKRLGSAHIAAVNLRAEMHQYERLVFEELQRIGQSYRSDYQIAKARFENLKDNLREMMLQTAGDNKTLVELRELERESETYKELYRTFLERYQQAIQQQSFPITDARVITAATQPLRASWPKKGLIFALGLIGGGLGGFALAMFLETRDRVFRTGDQVRADLGLEFLGLLPMLSVGDARPSAADPLPAGRLGPIAPTMRFVLDDPLSGFSETLRAAKVATDIALRGRRPKIIGVVSVFPGEGKTTVSKNFASLIANLGSKTILIDADLRNPGLSRAVAPTAVDGLVEVLKGEKSVADVVLHESESGLVVLPSVIHRRLANSSELLSSPAMRALLTQVGGTFDYVVVDLPPVGPVVDVRAAAEAIDAFVFVAEWGKTPRQVVQAAWETEYEMMEKCIGVILNKVDEDRIGLYHGSEYRNYHYSKYKKYYSS